MTTAKTTSKTKGKATSATQYNKVIDYADYVKHGFQRRKAWEVHMALTTLRDFGATGDDKFILGVGAGNEPTLYHLTKEAKLVFATDMYANSGVWGNTAPPTMLTNPAEFAQGIEYDPQRLIVQHMDGRTLNYPDNFFDGVFSSGSIEHFGEWTDIAQSAKEIGRVVKQGGIVSLSTEFKISGDGDGWDGCKLFTPDDIQEYIVKPSGLTLVDEPVYTVTDETLSHSMTLTQAIYGKVDIETVLEQAPYTFTSVHLALRKD